VIWRVSPTSQALKTRLQLLQLHIKLLGRSIGRYGVNALLLEVAGATEMGKRSTKFGLTITMIADIVTI
jgi:hypothetical protein